MLAGHTIATLATPASYHIRAVEAADVRRPACAGEIHATAAAVKAAAPSAAVYSHPPSAIRTP